MSRRYMLKSSGYSSLWVILFHFPLCEFDAFILKKYMLLAGELDFDLFNL